MIVYIYNIGVDLYNGFNGLRHRINWTYFTVLDGLAHPLYSVSGYGDPSYVNHVMRYVGITFRGGTNPNFNNMEAWITKNPYAKTGLYGQCTWFA